MNLNDCPKYSKAVVFICVITQIPVRVNAYPTQIPVHHLVFSTKSPFIHTLFFSHLKIFYLYSYKGRSFPFHKKSPHMLLIEHAGTFLSYFKFCYPCTQRCGIIYSSFFSSGVTSAVVFACFLR